MSKKIVERRPFPVLAASCDVFDRRGCVQVTPKRYSSKNDLKTKEREKIFFGSLALNETSEFLLLSLFCVSDKRREELQKSSAGDIYLKTLRTADLLAGTGGGLIKRHQRFFFSAQLYVFACVCLLSARKAVKTRGETKGSRSGGDEAAASLISGLWR